ncbi:MAG: FAD-binding oxidoreductase, partial [Candidatus Saccharimonadales bacterium]
WQLAEKGHVLPLTARGGGTDQTGGAISAGVVLSLPTHMHSIFEFDAKQKLIRVQPGVLSRTLDAALRLQGMSIPALPLSAEYATVGGAVANNSSSALSGAYGAMDSWVKQVEVVLSNGDVLQTQRLSKRDLNKKKGIQTFEGEIYRNIDNLIEDNKKLIDEKLGGKIRDNVGYASIAKVKAKDGSLDLTPLIIGSQGTLGIISELILKAEYVSAHCGAMAIAFTSRNAARDTLDTIRLLKPATLDYYDGELFTLAAEQGRKYELCSSVEGLVEAVVVLSFDDFNESARSRKLKRVKKLLEKIECQTETANGVDAKDVMSIRDVTTYTLLSQVKDVSAPPLFDGFYVPRERFEDFQIAVAALAKKLELSLPMHGRALEDVYYTRPMLQLKKVGDKQKIFKLADEFSMLIDQHGGHMVADAGEGRIKSRFAYKHLDDDVIKLFADIRAIFDPHTIMNPGVKQPAELKQLVEWLSSDYNSVRRSGFSRHN